jgi:amidase
MSDHDPRGLPLAALADGLRRGELSSEAVTRAYLDRIEAVNPRLNAVVQLRREAALAEARAADRAPKEGRGALHGVPVTIKDSLDTAGIVSTGGTKGRAAYVPEADATVVRRLRAAGAIVMGKTNTPDLTLSYETDNLVYGRTSNPFDVARTSGGSSGGACAIVAAGGSPLDVGSDTGGSIRLPAHFCGIAGLKPTAGRVPRSGHIIDYTGACHS